MRLKSRGLLLALVAVLTMSAVTATSALAAGKPLVETKPATAITKSEATLNGEVDPNGAETTYHFEYGPTTAYGTSTPEVYVGSGTSLVEELQKLAGLLADKGYDFRIVAKNTYGTTDGANETFTTSGPKVPLAETMGGSAITEAGATLNGVVNPNGVETKYSFQYGTTISYGKETAAVSAGAGTTNLNESKAITGLTAKTTYHYRIVATNANGTTDGPDETLYSKVGPEFKPFPTDRKFTLSSGRSEWASGSNEIVCAKTSASGEIDGAETVGNVIVVFTGCTSSGRENSDCTANSEGAKPGEIVTTPLTGELGTVATSEAPSGVGLRFKQSPKGAWFELQENECSVGSAFEGELAAEVSLIGKRQTTNTLLFVPSGSTEKIKEITLDSGLLEKTSLKEFGAAWTIKDTDELTFEQELEVT